MNVAQSIDINHVVLDRIFLYSFCSKGAIGCVFFHFVRSSFVNFHFVRVFLIIKKIFFRKVRSFSKKNYRFFRNHLTIENRSFSDRHNRSQNISFVQ